MRAAPTVPDGPSPLPGQFPSYFLTIACTYFLLLLSWGYSDTELPLTTWQGETMGSVYTVKIAGVQLGEKKIADLRTVVEARLKAVNRQISHYQPDSELSQFNRAPAHQPVKISPEFARLVQLSVELAQRSGGAFDPTLGPVINLWGFGEQTHVRQVPTKSDLEEAFRKTGCQHFSLTNGQLLKDIPGLQLNLSAIGKGFGVDEITQVLQAHGFTNTYVSISGEVFTRGHNAKGQKWQIGVSAPVSNWRPGDPLVAVLSISGQAVSTSGDYQKFFFDAQGRRLCHIFDPKTGYPIQHNLGSVTVVADNSTIADGLSTTLFVLGPEEGLRFIEKWPNAAALFVVRQPDGNFRQVLSSRFTQMTAYKPE